MENNQIQEMQMLEQNLQNLFMQKQAFQMESAETKSALAEIDKSGDEVFKIIGQLMVKTDKVKMKEELENKNKIINLRLKTLEKQEEKFSEKAQKLRDELMKQKEK